MILLCQCQARTFLFFFGSELFMVGIMNIFVGSHIWQVERENEIKYMEFHIIYLAFPVKLPDIYMYNVYIYPQLTRFNEVPKKMFHASM